MYGLYWFETAERTNEDGSPKIPVLLDTFEEFPRGTLYSVQIARVLQRVLVYGLKWPIKYDDCVHLAVKVATKKSSHDLPGGGLLFIQKMIVT